MLKSHTKMVEQTGKKDAAEHVPVITKDVKHFSLGDIELPKRACGVEDHEACESCQ